MSRPSDASVLDAVRAGGKTSVEIAARIGCTPGPVKKRLKALLRKGEVRTEKVGGRLVWREGSAGDA